VDDRIRPNIKPGPHNVQTPKHIPILGGDIVPDESQRMEFDRQHYETAYPPGIENNFWNLARNWIIEKELRAAAAAALFHERGLALEIGCGAGIVVKYLRNRGWNIFGSELGNPALMPGTEKVIWTSQPAEDLEPEFRLSVQCILLLDVIEHIEDEVGFLNSIKMAFPNCSCFIVTVPARREAWSNYDEFYGHYRRHNSETLADTFRNAGLALRYQGYFFQSLYIAAMVVNFLRIKRRIRLSAGKRLWLNRVIAQFLYLERRVMPSAIPGLSLLGVGVR
jgi:hypothetical protein